MIRKFFLFLLLVPSITRADFSCSSDVSYKWKAQPHRGAPTPLPEATPPPDTTVFYSSLSVVADTEENAKSKLQQELLKSKAQAESSCKEEHENQTKCIANKYEKFSALHQSLGFNARKEIEKSIAADCEKQVGTCTGTSASEAVCKELPKKEGEDEVGGTDSKGKEKDKEKGKDAKKK